MDAPGRILPVTHCIGFPFSSSSVTAYAALVWSCSLGLTPVHLQELYRHVSSMVDRPLLRAYSGDELFVPRVNTSTMQRRTFSVTVVVAPFTIYMEFTIHRDLLCLYSTLYTLSPRLDSMGGSPSIGFLRGPSLNFPK